MSLQQKLHKALYGNICPTCRQPKQTAEEIYEHIKHGDDDHKAWLLEKLREILPKQEQPQ